MQKKMTKKAEIPKAVSYEKSRNSQDSKYIWNKGKGVYITAVDIIFKYNFC